MKSFHAFGQTDTGCIRVHNEDAFLIHRFESPGSDRSLGLLAIVADGVGGHMGGRQASSASVNAIKEYFEKQADREPEKTLINAIEETHLLLKRMAAENPELRGMGTTCTAVWAKDREAYVAQVGDSRAYLFRNGKPTQITEDHTLVQRLYKEGKISDGDIADHPDKNIILQALGASDVVDIDLFHVVLEPEDVILLCSDGLHGLVKDREMAEIIGKTPLNDVSQQLILLAKERGGYDNITVVILKPYASNKTAGVIEVSEGTDVADTKKHKMEIKRWHRKHLFYVLLILFLAAAAGYAIVYYVKSSDPPSHSDREPSAAIFRQNGSNLRADSP